MYADSPRLLLEWSKIYVENAQSLDVTLKPLQETSVVVRAVRVKRPDRALIFTGAGMMG